MINQQLLDFIKQQFQHGIDYDQIKKALLTNGWSSTDVEEAFGTLRTPVQPKKKRWKKFVLIIVSIIIVVLVIFFLFVALISKNMQTGKYFSSCSYAYSDLKIPEYLTNTEIIFEKQIYGGLDKHFSKNCLSLYDNGSNILRPGKSSLAPIKMDIEEKFTVYKRVYIICAGFTCMDAGGDGDILLLKDAQGTIWETETSSFTLTTNTWELENYRFKAGYYKNKERKGDVILEVISNSEMTNLENNKTIWEE